MTPIAEADELHVSPGGDDRWPGTAIRPLRTIQRAADLVRPGQVVTVHEGIYRERVDPPRGGESHERRVVFRAADGERAEIRGSEIVSGWTRDGEHDWSTTISDSLFGHGTNPFRELIGGDWFWGEHRAHHTADVYVDGVSLFEAPSIDGVRNPVVHEAAVDPGASRRTWYAEAEDGATRVWIAIGSDDPNENLVEVNVRPACFLPSRPGVDFVTVRGFVMCHAATQWAPPTAAQTGMVGPGWSRGWIIEDNVLHDSRCTAVSLGQDGRFGQNAWTRLHVKHGTQRQRDAVFAAVNDGWSRDTIGSHVVRNNEIYQCEQAGICGNLGAIFSEISGNHIHDIHVKNQFNGAEIAGIKLHAPIDTTISGNHVHHCGRGIWTDWQAQGTRITRNLLYANSSEDIFVEVTHGPCTVDDNVSLSPVSIRNLSQGTAFVHNLFAGQIVLERVLIRYTPYHLPHSTAVAGLMTVQGGDDTWLNNVFLTPVGGDLAAAVGGQIQIGDIQGADATDSAAVDGAPGLAAYDGYPIPGDDWCTGLFVDEYLEHRYPSRFGGNVYQSGTAPFHREPDAVQLAASDQVAQLTADDGIRLHIPAELSWNDVRRERADATRLPDAFAPELPFENPDGTALDFELDYAGTARGATTIAGPFASVGSDVAIRLWPLNGSP